MHCCRCRARLTISGRHVVIVSQVWNICWKRLSQIVSCQVVCYDIGPLSFVIHIRSDRTVFHESPHGCAMCETHIGNIVTSFACLYRTCHTLRIVSACCIIIILIILVIILIIIIIIIITRVTYSRADTTYSRAGNPCFHPG